MGEFGTLENLVRSFASMDSLVTGAQAGLIEFHGTVRAFETRFSYDFVRFALFLA